jgi:hypothetical protein
MQREVLLYIALSFATISALVGSGARCQVDAFDKGMP